MPQTQYYLQIALPVEHERVVEILEARGQVSPGDQLRAAIVAGLDTWNNTRECTGRLFGSPDDGRTWVAAIDFTLNYADSDVPLIGLIQTGPTASLLTYDLEYGQARVNVAVCGHCGESVSVPELHHCRRVEFIR